VNSARAADVPVMVIGTVGGDRLVIQVDGEKPADGCRVDLELTPLFDRWAMAIPRALGHD
jgi:hypothetical protein